MRTGGFCGGRVTGYGAGLHTKSPVMREMTPEEKAKVAFDKLSKKDQVAVRLRFGDKLVDWHREYKKDAGIA